MTVVSASNSYSKCCSFNRFVEFKLLDLVHRVQFLTVPEGQDVKPFVSFLHSDSRFPTNTALDFSSKNGNRKQYNLRRELENKILSPSVQGCDGSDLPKLPIRRFGPSFKFFYFAWLEGGRNSVNKSSTDNCIFRVLFDWKIVVCNVCLRSLFVPVRADFLRLHLLHYWNSDLSITKSYLWSRSVSDSSQL